MPVLPKHCQVGWFLNDIISLAFHEAITLISVKWSKNKATKIIKLNVIYIYILYLHIYLYMYVSVCVVTVGNRLSWENDVDLKEWISSFTLTISLKGKERIKEEEIKLI